MRKLIAYIITALILTVSCVSELEQGGAAVEGSLEGAPVMITFSVPDIPVLPSTKSLENGDGDITSTPYLDPEKVYVVVCGGKQSIKYIRKAKQKGDPLPNQEVPQDKYPLSEGDRHVTLYEFEVELELSDVERTIHILGNVDENQLITGSYAYNSLPNMLSYDNKQAYWQRIYVPHIKAKIDPQTQKPKTQDGRYVPDDETKGFFQYIPLIRNFAKIQVTNVAENFHLHSYAVIYYPERGSVVPYRSNETVKENRFDFNPPSGYLLSGYERSSFEDLETMQYLGNMPSNIVLSKDIPSAEEFEDPSTSGGRVLLYDPTDTETDSGFYIYERGIPNDKIGPTFIIVCGKFDKDDNLYYYRLDLMESKVEGTQTVSKYYPIYRNFRYDIQLHRISSEGVLTPGLAAVSSGAEDISADVSMRHLSDISNGTTRLVVEPFMTRTYSGPAEEGQYYELYARFFDNVYSDKPNLETAAVKVELEPMTDGSDDILILYDGSGIRVPEGGFFFPEPATVGGVPGMRTIHFDTVEPLNETKTQKIKITGHKPGNPQERRLYREVEITLQKKQPLTVTCTDPVPAFTNTPLTVDITIPSELPESMFPLEFIVEPEARTLTPDTSKDINMPVVSGRSIATEESAFKDTPAFYFIRTLTWEEFSGLPVSEGKRTFKCYFKTNRDFSVTTIWVYNEYFSKDSTSFENKMPLSLICTDPVLAVEETPVILALSIQRALPESMFPLEFIVEPEDATIVPDPSMSNNMHVKVGPSIVPNVTEYVYHYIRTLTWSEYSSLPVNENLRTFYCYFKSNTAKSATTIWAYCKDFYKESVAFENEDPEFVLDNQFWVMADPDEANGCKVAFTCKGNGNYGTHVLQYNLDESGWMPYQNEAVIELEPGHKVAWRSVGTSDDWNADHGFKFYCYTGNKKDSKNGKFSVGGNIASLIMGDNYPDAEDYKGAYSFVNFFKGHTNLTDASELVLPMLTCKDMCYKSMFEGCTSLVRPPQLPATALAKQCYRNMFFNCSSLEYAPELPAAKLVNGAYQRMFYGCSNISYIKMLGTNWKASDNVFISAESTFNPYNGTKTYYWCDGVASEGVIEMDPSLENAANWATTWGTIIPAGWTVRFGPEE